MKLQESAENPAQCGIDRIQGTASVYAITDVTRQVGDAAAHASLGAGHTVRAVLRDKSRVTEWREWGAEVAIASLEDADALVAAFSGTAGVFVMVAPNWCWLNWSSVRAESQQCLCVGGSKYIVRASLVR